jgi:hypothetical protein
MPAHSAVSRPCPQGVTLPFQTTAPVPRGCARLLSEHGRFHLDHALTGRAGQPKVGGSITGVGVIRGLPRLFRLGHRLPDDAQGHHEKG